MNIDSNVELKKSDIKNRTCYFFDDIKWKILILVIFYWIQNHTEIF